VKELNPLLNQVARRASATPLPSASRPDAVRSSQGHDRVDVINQVFAEFELAYHNQFHKAYAQEGSLALAKKYWLGCLADYPPDIILRAVRKVVKTLEFLPTVAAVVSACEDTTGLYGLPDAASAYQEACLATEPRYAYGWSHPAVYHAGVLTGWFELASQTRQEVFPVFSYYYALLCRQVMQGKALDLVHPKALPEQVQSPLSPAENKARLVALKAQFGLN